MPLRDAIAALRIAIERGDEASIEEMRQIVTKAVRKGLARRAVEKAARTALD